MLTYREMIARFAVATGQRPPVVVTVPVLTPRLASHWVGLVTPISSDLAKPLVGSLVHEVVVKERDIDDHVEVPGGYIGFDSAVRQAMGPPPPHGAAQPRATSAATVAAAVVGSLATAPDSRWYRSLDLPDWQPPPLAFPVVWTALYADIALVAAAAVAELAEQGRESQSRDLQRALAVNMALNTGWSAAFFRAHRPAAAAAECAILTLSGADLARRARPAGPGKAAGLAAYAGWCAFATVLTTAIARRNRRRT